MLNEALALRTARLATIANDLPENKPSTRESQIQIQENTNPNPRSSVISEPENIELQEKSIIDKETGTVSVWSEQRETSGRSNEAIEINLNE